MAWLIVRIEPMANDSLSEKEKKPIICTLTKRVPMGLVNLDKTSDLLEIHGYELGPVIGKRTAGDWPLTAYVYVSANIQGQGRGASSLHRWPVRKAS